VRIENPRRNQVQLEHALVGFDSVPGVGAAIGAHDNVGISR
jgi:hypothetical protein